MEINQSKNFGIWMIASFVVICVSGKLDGSAVSILEQLIDHWLILGIIALVLPVLVQLTKLILSAWIKSKKLRSKS